MREFWVSSGHHLSRQNEAGELAATPELLMAWLARPELAPPPEACDAERALHAALLADPFRKVEEHDVAALADVDARENWSFFLRFRDRLARAPSIEAAYRDLALAPRIDLPPLFLDQLAHLVLRNALDGCEDPYTLRAGELFFRAQRASVHDGVLTLADADLVDEIEKGRAAMMHVAPLTAMLEKDELDVMDDENAWTYWSRSDANSMAMNLGGNSKARAGLGKAIAAWVTHLTGVKATVEPIAKMEDRDWRWFVGLDAEGTRIGNALWRGESLKAGDMDRVIALFRLSFAEDAKTQALVDKRVRGRPVYLILGMGADRMVRLKPQNLVAGLPLENAAPKERAQ
ncbi:MAG: hypothetical protein K2Y29_01260 [Beijerinckiaceae bacterium]|nr:hypothetical protein [Beijerinckiaceae bacterium]